MHLEVKFDEKDQWKHEDKEEDEKRRRTQSLAYPHARKTIILSINIAGQLLSSINHTQLCYNL